MGHLVTLREGDLAFLHVHPLKAGEEPSQIRFHATFPSPGRYGLFLEFSHGGEVHFARFVLELAQPRAEAP